MADQFIATNHPYWIPYSVGLTGDTGETVPGSTVTAFEDLSIVGGLSNLQSSQAWFSTFSGNRLGSSGPLRADDRIPIAAMFGKRDSARPMIGYPPGFTIRRNDRIKVEVLNVGAEDGGWLVWAGIPTRAQGQQVLQSKLSGLANFHFALNAGFSAEPEEVTSDTSISYTRDLLILGAYTDMDAPSIGIAITDHAGNRWCPPGTYVPAWALAGRDQSQLPLLRWHVPYVLPKQEILRAEFQNAIAGDTPESNGTITFECLELED